MNRKRPPFLESLWDKSMLFRVLVVLTSPWWISMGFALLLFAGAPAAGLLVAAFGRSVATPFRVLLGLAVPTYVTLYVIVDRSFASTPNVGGGDMAPLFELLANAGTVVLLLLGAIVLFAALADGTRD
jgi:hypothetical protein